MIIVFKEESLAFKKLDILYQRNLLREQSERLERKYDCSLEEFRSRVNDSDSRTLQREDLKPESRKVHSSNFYETTPTIIPCYPVVLLLRTVVGCALWVVGKSRERASRVRFAHEKARAKIGTDGLLASVPFFAYQCSCSRVLPTTVLVTRKN
jgi:hypothetical protein